MKKWLIIGAIVGLVLTVGLLWLFIAQEWLDEVRDIAVIVLALFQLISTLLMIVLLAALVIGVSELRRLAREQITPKVNDTLENVKAVSGTARETTAYIAEGVVSPFIKLASLTAGVRAGARVLAQRRVKHEQGEVLE